jgi:hypothetical protein
MSEIFFGFIYCPFAGTVSEDLTAFTYSEGLAISLAPKVTSWFLQGVWKYVRMP